MFAGSRPQAKQTFLGLQTTMKCNGLNQLQGVTVLYKGWWRETEELYFLEKNPQLDIL